MYSGSPWFIDSWPTPVGANIWRLPPFLASQRCWDVEEHGARNSNPGLGGRDEDACDVQDPVPDTGGARRRVGGPGRVQAHGERAASERDGDGGPAAQLAAGGSLQA